MNDEQKKYYGKYEAGLEKCQTELMAEINRIISILSVDSEHRPVEHVLTRIKESDSAQNKLQKLGFSSDSKSALVNLSDIVGARIVTHFLGDIYDILGKIKQSDAWEVVQIKDYIQNSKPNGYRSLHIILSLSFPDAEIPSIAVEIQMRTIAMDCWAALEHQIKYKKEIDDVEFITRELKRCADEMASTDLSMQSIRDVIADM